MSQDVDRDRRRFFGTAAMTLAAAQLALSGSADAQSGKAKPADLRKTKPGTHTSFGSLKQIDAGLLNVGYAEAGPAGGPPVILLHGWPYDIHSFVDVTPMLAQAGYRVIVPYLRGYGTTRFLAAETMRNGEPSAVAVDIIALMDALKIEKATLAALAGALQGHGFGERLPDRQPGIRQDAAAAKGRAAMVVSVLFRHRTRSRRLRKIPARFCKTHLATGVAEMGF